MFGSAAVTSAHNPNGDVELPSAPDDGVSSLTFSPNANFLVATSWDTQVRCWEIGPNGQGNPKAAVRHDQPVLCSAWSGDGTKVFTGGCDKQVKVWDLASNQQQQVAAHDAPIRRVFFIKEVNMLVTGAWDKTVKYWDCRQPNPVLTVQLPERVYAMDVRHPLLTVGTADRNITAFHLSNPSTPYKQVQSPLKWQTRCIANFPDASGYLVGSIEGRVAVHHVEDSQTSKNFTFKCHREGQDRNPDIYAVNDIQFHPKHGTFVTAGSDGVYNFWDKENKSRLKQMKKANFPIPCGSFNYDGTFYAYAVSYDWSKGWSEYNPSQHKNYILVHTCQDVEVKKKDTRNTRR